MICIEMVNPVELLEKKVQSSYVGTTSSHKARPVARAGGQPSCYVAYACSARDTINPLTSLPIVFDRESFGGTRRPEAIFGQEEVNSIS